MKGEFQPVAKPEASSVIVAGEKVDLDAITNHYITTRAMVIDVFIPVPGAGIQAFKFKPYPRQSEYQAMLQTAADFYRGLPAYGSDTQKAHEWADFWPMDAQEYLNAFVISTLSIDPKISIQVALVWLAHPNLVSTIIDQIEKDSHTVQEATYAVLVEAKKNAWSEVASGETQPISVSESGGSPAN